MTQSMTAFARTEATLKDTKISLELRSVNHRYLDITIRSPDEIRDVEQKIRAQLSSALSRGKVEVNIRIQHNAVNNSDADIHLNMDLIEQLSKASSAITERIANADKVNPLDILRWPGVMQAPQLDSSELQKIVLQCIDDALNEFIATRKREGEKLGLMLLERCEAMEKIRIEVDKLIPDILKVRRDKIQTRLAEIDVEHDGHRLEQEMVLLAQKMDVTEELDRIGAHITEVKSVLSSSKPVGRRLDFLMQELNREANTLGSKSVDTQSTRASVDLKVLIEQMREQVQNIE